jgi:hypothetical protein
VSEIIKPPTSKVAAARAHAKHVFDLRERELLRFTIDSGYFEHEILTASISDEADLAPYLLQLGERWRCARPLETIGQTRRPPNAVPEMKDGEGVVVRGLSWL